MTVIVPVYNGAHILPTTVPAVLGLDAASIVYVDDGSTDRTPEALRDLASGDARVQILRHETNRGRSASRNTGVAATGDALLLFLDADVEPLPGYVDAMRSALAAPRAVAAIAGDIEHADARGAYAEYVRSGRRGPKASGGPVPWRHFLSGVACLRREALGSVGGFDVRVAYGEDLALATRLWRLAPDGLRVAPEARVRLHDVGDLSTALAKMRAFASGLGTLSEADPDVLAVAGLGRLRSRRASDRVLRRLAGWRAPAHLARGAVEHLPRALQPLAVRYLLGHTLARHA